MDDLFGKKNLSGMSFEVFARKSYYPKQRKIDNATPVH